MPNHDSKWKQENHVLHGWLSRIRFRALALPDILPDISRLAPQLTASLLKLKKKFLFYSFQHCAIYFKPLKNISFFSHTHIIYLQFLVLYKYSHVDF